MPNCFSEDYIAGFADALGKVLEAVADLQADAMQQKDEKALSVLRDVVAEVREVRRQRGEWLAQYLGERVWLEKCFVLR